ncbi:MULTISPECIES: DegV family protein [Enterococcus]|jgi:DegV family protein with EDD domain|uniref:DegV family protein n=1 Tax=Enterococcus TaxID=1350 RepID=UPI00189EF8FA|nr:DegV family protein [Enterococcus dispar]MDT2705980.1 DegV family protein [Enterococcus dispar]WCG32005.1 DegV family protein [Enterococcus dispar]
MFQIVTDSCCDIPFQFLDEAGIAFLPMLVEINGKEYQDDLGKTFDVEFFYKALKDKQMPTTSQINVGRYLEFFEPYAKKDIPVIYLSFSSGMSGSYYSALQAVEVLKEDYPNAKVAVVDTLAASLGQGLLVLGAKKQQDAGKNFEEVIAWVDEQKMLLQSWVTVDDLKHLERGGRISKSEATLGGLLKVKPIIHVDKNGKLQNVDKVRGRNKSLQKIIDETLAHLTSREDQIVYIAYSGDVAAAETVLAGIVEEVAIEDIACLPLGPTISAHTGLGCVAIFTFGKNRSEEA